MDVEGCPKWCSGELDTTKAHYGDYVLIKSCLADDTDALFQTRDHFLRLLDTLAASRMFSIEISGALFRFDPKAKMLWEDKVEVVVVKGLEDVLR